MVFINYCTKDKKGKHKWQIDNSSDGVLIRCLKCNIHIVTLQKKIYKKKVKK